MVSPRARVPVCFGIFFACFMSMFSPSGVQAASLTYVRDTVSTSAPGAGASHVIEFTVTHAIPESGKIVLVPQDGVFSIPAALSYEDIDFAVASGPTFIDSTLDAFADTDTIGVDSVSGVHGILTFTLSSAAGIPAGTKVKITIGTAASYGGAGNYLVVNPIPVGSYRLGITTTDASGNMIDTASAMMAVVAQVGVGVTPVIVEPTRFNGAPSGHIPAGSSNVEISLNTDGLASCRYATSPGISFGSMTGRFSPPIGNAFATVVTGLQNNTTYTYYVRCNAQQGAENSDDYLISFTLDATPTVTTSLGGGGGGRGGIGPFPGGSSVLYLSSVSLSGWTSPLSTVKVLKDGILQLATQAKADGSFRTDMPDLERGVYTFVASSVDVAGRRSSPVSSTITLSAGTHNSISDLVVPPTLSLEQANIGVGDPAHVSGASVPGSAIEMVITPNGSSAAGGALTFAASSTAAGLWKIDVPAGTLSRGTYDVRARVLVTADHRSEYGEGVPLGVGETVVARPQGASVSDLNGDDKVNLVDFSILLSQWNQPSAESDFNKDGIVNLADFSILLFNWTG